MLYNITLYPHESKLRSRKITIHDTKTSLHTSVNINVFREEPRIKTYNWLRQFFKKERYFLTIN